MKYLFGFIDKWLTIGFIIIVLVIVFLANKCQSAVEPTEEPTYSGQQDTSNSNIEGIRIVENSTYKHIESGVIITIENMHSSSISCTYTLPDGTNKSEDIDIGKGFGFVGNGGQNYDVLLLSVKDNYAVFSIEKGVKFRQNEITTKVNEDFEEEPYQNDNESGTLKVGETLDEDSLNIYIEYIDYKNRTVDLRCVIGDKSENLQLKVGVFHYSEFNGKKYKFKVTDIKDELFETYSCKIHYWTPDE